MCVYMSTYSALGRTCAGEAPQVTPLELILRKEREESADAEWLRHHAYFSHWSQNYLKICRPFHRLSRPPNKGVLYNRHSRFLLVFFGYFLMCSDWFHMA